VAQKIERRSADISPENPNAAAATPNEDHRKTAANPKE